MDLIKAIAKDQGFKIEINPGFDAAVSDVQSAMRKEMIAGMTCDRCSEETFD